MLEFSKKLGWLLETFKMAKMTNFFSYHLKPSERKEIIWKELGLMKKLDLKVTHCPSTQA